MFSQAIKNFTRTLPLGRLSLKHFPVSARCLFLADKACQKVGDVHHLVFLACSCEFLRFGFIQKFGYFVLGLSCTLSTLFEFTHAQTARLPRRCMETRLLFDIRAITTLIDESCWVFEAVQIFDRNVFEIIFVIHELCASCFILYKTILLVYQIL